MFDTSVTCDACAGISLPDVDYVFQVRPDGKFKFFCIGRTVINDNYLVLAKSLFDR
jgi:hypothetical protein